MKKIALLFPGQGSQYVGMGQKLVETYPVARKTFEEASDALKIDLHKCCFEGPIDTLTRTEYAQPAILTTSVAAFRVYMQEIGVKPQIAAGHSLGEFSALTCAGAISLADAVRLVHQRGKFMQEAVAIGIGAMSSIADIDQEMVKKLCNHYEGEGSVTISNYNAPNQVVISGHQDAVSQIGEQLKKLGATVVPLKVSAPFHSPLMQQAAERFKEELAKYDFRAPEWPILSNVDGLPYSDPDLIVQKLGLQMTEPVQWQLSMQYLEKQGIDIAVELGPKTVLRNLLKKNVSSIPAYSYDKEEDVQAFMKSLGLLPKQPQGFVPTVVTMCLAIAVSTKNRNWDQNEYQKGVIEPYRQLKEMQQELEDKGSLPTVEQMEKALEILQTIFDTKRVPKQEQQEWFEEIVEKTGTQELFPRYKSVHKV